MMPDSLRFFLRVLGISALVMSAVGCGAPTERETLNVRQLETPRFDPPPPPTGTALHELRTDLAGPEGRSLLAKFVPSQGAALLIALLVMLLVAFDWNRPGQSRNIELLALLPIGFLLFEVMRFFALLQDPSYWQLMDAVFISIMFFSVLLLAFALTRMKRPHAEPWRPNLPKRALMVLTLVLLSLNVMAGLLREPDDVGFYTNLGAQRLRERAMFPYGDPLLTNTPGATYSPILYFSHLAYQVMLVPVQNAPDPRPEFGVYVLPPILASQLATVTFHILGVIGLFVAARRLIGNDGAWGVTALYCGSAYVMGVGGDREMINGMTFASHIAPAAVTMLAFAALPRPWLSGALLATATWTLFYPAFFFPAWAGYYWRSRTQLIAFVGGFAIAGLVIGVPVLLRSQPIEGRGVISTGAPRNPGPPAGSQRLRIEPVRVLGPARRHPRDSPRPARGRTTEHGAGVSVVCGLRGGRFFPRAREHRGPTRAFDRRPRHRNAVVEDPRHRCLRDLVLRFSAPRVFRPSRPCLMADAGMADTHS